VGTNHISGTVEARVIKFCTRVGYIKFQHMADKPPLKGHSQGHVTHFKFSGPQIRNDIPATAKARVTLALAVPEISLGA